MRRKDREITDRQEILSILHQCTVGHMAMVDEEGWPYLLPMNYCCEEKDGIVRVYLHCAKQGRKLDILKNNDKVCFEVDTGHEMVEAAQPCAFTFNYQSVIGFGRAAIVADVEEKVEALKLFMRHQTGREYAMDARHSMVVEIIRLDLDRVTGKRRQGK